jgi:hypothetical protein
MTAWPKSALTIFTFVGLLLPARAASLHEEIDHWIAAGWKTHSVTPSALCSDADFLRRVSLDLTGTIPTAVAARTFIDDTTADKRARLVDRLLASPEFGRHMAHVFDVVLLERQYGNNVTDVEWHDYLRTSFNANKPWNRLVGELVGADGAETTTRPAIKFYMVRTVDSYRVLNPNHITRDVGRLFLGVNLQCAQCHDHPSIDDYKQADYFGIKAFVERLYIHPLKQGAKSVMVLAEKPDGEIRFYSVFDKAKVEKMASPHMPGCASVPEPMLVKGKEYVVAPSADKMPVPAHSRRANLVKLLTASDNQAFRRTSANRFWELMMGRGLVHPVELTHAGNPASHPELLDLLGRRFAESNFDVKALLRELALSRTYQLSNLAASSPSRPDVATFAVAPLRPLRPEQLAFTVMQATGLADADRLALGTKADEASLYARLSPHMKPFVEAYARPAGQAESTYESSLFQALFLGNGGRVTGWLKPLPGNLTDRLLKHKSMAALADEFYMSVLTRKPTAGEVAVVDEFLRGRDSDRAQALQELAWALIASAEFRFNH